MRHVTLGMWADTKKAQNPSGITGILSDSYNAWITWVNPNISLYDYIQVERQINGGAWVFVQQLAKGIATLVDSPGNSIDVKYRITAVKVGWNNSDSLISPSIRTLPAPPSPQNLTSANDGVINFYANSPGHGNIVGFDAAISTDGGASWSGVYDAGGDPNMTWTGIGHGLMVQARGRTRDGFGQVSAWAAWGSWVRSINDLTAPTAPVPNVANSFNGTQWHVWWTPVTDAQSAISSVYLQMWNSNYGYWYTIQPKDMGWQNLGNISDVQVETLYGADRGAQIKFRLVTTDIWGNTATGGESVSVWTRPQGWHDVFCAQNDYWTDTLGWRNAWFPYSDNAGSRGGWFYTGRIQALCHGYVPTSCSMLIIKKDYMPGESGFHSIQLMTNDRWDDTNPGGGYGGSAPNLVGGGDPGPNLTLDGEYSEYPLPYAFYYSLGVGSSNGICLVDSGAPRRCIGVNQNSNSGRLRFYFN